MDQIISENKKLIKSFENCRNKFPEYFDDLILKLEKRAETISQKYDNIIISKTDIRKELLKNEKGENRNFFTITSKEDFQKLIDKDNNEEWGEAIIYSPLNNHSRGSLKKGDVLFCYRQGQFANLDQALNTRGIYGVGIATDDPHIFYPNEEGHNQWGIIISFPIQLQVHLSVRNIQMHPLTIDLTPYNGNRNDALQKIHDKKQYKALLNLLLSTNKDLKLEKLFSDISIKPIELPENYLNRYYSNNEIVNSILLNENKLLEEFVIWFNKPENFKSSYNGIVNIENLKFWNSTYFDNKLFKINGQNRNKAYEEIKKSILENNKKSWIDFNLSSSKGAPKAVLGEKNYLKYLNVYLHNYSFKSDNKKEGFDIKQFLNDVKLSELKYKPELITRYIASLATKPFVLLSGLSGSGKTKLAQAFAQWICESEDQYTLIPVGADWTNREPLLGYPNALKDNEYVKPDNDALDILMRAKQDENRPYFLILDEMNLSHVERYFADFLSTMESKNSIPLHKIEIEKNGIPNNIKLPKNLFIVGTVNIDETTYMFSPKVLDRANTIEFRVSDTDISGFLKNPKDIDLDKLNGEGANMAVNFVEIATATKNGVKIEEDYKLTKSQDVINNLFKELQKSGAEFGYRTAFEISKLIYKLEEFGLKEENNKLDIAIMQKMLPKLHGSRTKLTRTLKPLAKLCLVDVNDKFDKEYFENFENIEFKTDKNIKYKLSFEKIMRMYKNAVENGFASYAEA